MTEIKWIKITTDIFDNQKIQQIESLENGDAIIVIWLKLLTLAGKVNDDGMIYLTTELPYTEEMLATAFHKPISTIRMALNIFEKFKMIDREDDILHIANWEKYQNVEGMEKVREQTRRRVAKFRENQKMLSQKECNVTVTPSNGIEEDKEEEREIEKEIKEDNKSTSNFLKHSKQEIKLDAIVVDYNTICTNLPKLRAFTDKRKKALEKLYKKYGIDSIKEVFEIANNSDFLTGNNDRGWRADFDFMMREDKFIAILEGKYSGKKKSNRNKFGETDLEKSGYSGKEKLHAIRSF